MEGQRKITFAYDVAPYDFSEILGNENDSFANLINFLSWSGNGNGRFILAFEQYLRCKKA